MVNTHSLKVSQLPFSENELILGLSENKEGEDSLILTADQHTLYGYKYQGRDKAGIYCSARIKLPKPISRYKKLFLIGRDSAETFDIGDDSSYPSIKESLIVLDKYGKLEIRQLKSIGDDYKIIAQQGYLLGTKYDDDTHTSSIIVLDVATNYRYSIYLPDKADPRTVLVDKKNRQLWINTNKLIWLCSFDEALSRVSVIEGNHYQTVNDSPKSRYGFSQEWKIGGCDIFCYEQNKQGGFKLKRRLENAIQKGISPTRQLLYYSRETDTSLDLYSYSFPKDQESLLYQGKPGSRISTQDSLLFLHKDDWYQLWDGAQYKITGSLQGLSSYLRSFLLDSDIPQQDILDKLDFRVLSPEYIFAAQQRISLKLDDNATGNIWRANELSNKCKIRKERGVTYLDIPSLLIHLQGGKCEYKIIPNALDHFYSMGNNYLSYVDSTANGYQIRLSKLECKPSGLKDSGLVKHDQDFQLRLDNNNIPKVEYITAGPCIAVLSPQTVHYFRQDDSGRSSWHSADLSEFDYLGGNPGKTVNTGYELWIPYYYGLVRHSMVSGISFAYDAKDGIPFYPFIWNYNKTIHFKEYNSPEVYQIKDQVSNVRVSLPWIEGKGKRFGTQKKIHLNHSYTDLRIPLDILNVMYPEKCVLEYRLLGYDDNWKQRNFVPELEYNKLKPGKYRLEVKAYTQNGYVSASALAMFQIHPPFWATWWAYLIYILAFIWIIRFLYLKRTRNLEARNLALEQQVRERTLELRQKQNKLTESIEYASLIQRSMLPPQESLQQLFQQHFIIWKQRDIVGGDFYWLYQIPDSKEVMFAMIDCTGHGVPGALLSITVNSLIKSVIQDRRIYDPARIFEILHNEMGAALYQDMGDNQQDGFEISLIKFDPESQELLFAGAGHKLIYGDNEGLQVLRGDRYGIGGLKRREKLSFHNNSLSYSPETIFYLYSDGILDQPNPKMINQKRLGTKGFLTILEDIFQRDIESQKMVLDDLIKDMLSYDEQRDDITIIGIIPG
ncbi:MAG: SpoIIE family protein phosphatase [Candidatus Cloacimonetes bacterium]|nr:SpoIIE family protein phosphatase [Candidatus Cloacimonadota bacterium]